MVVDSRVVFGYLQAIDVLRELWQERSEIPEILLCEYRSTVIFAGDCDTMPSCLRKEKLVYGRFIVNLLHYLETWRLL